MMMKCGVALSSAKLNRGLLGGVSALALTAIAPLPARAATTHGTKGPQLEEIVVTAQKRRQRLQDVPIAITAIGQASLQANRITNAAELNGVAPNVTVRQTGGSIGLPAFVIRGIVSYGVVPGSDKETSIYVDGVYLGAPEGSAFELPDISRIEILRGPQGTLFGRNATSGAVSIVTDDPTGKLGGRQEFTVGNYDQFRTRTTINLPAVGPFSGFVSYVHSQRNGDIRNSGAGTVWDRTGPNTGQGIEVSPKYLGSHDVNSYFAAIKYQPNDWFKTVYKFDYSEDNFTPDGIANVDINSAFLGPLYDLIKFSPGVITDPSGRRPDVVNNAFTTPGYQKNYGHNLTSTLQVNDSLSLKNILAYRSSLIYANTQLDGLGGVSLGPNLPFEVFAINTQSTARQFSDELQANYTSPWLTLTSGLLFFHQNSVAGAPPGLANNFNFVPIPDGRIPLGIDPVSSPGGWATSFNRATSLAAYSQAEVHVTKQVDLIGGVRVTDDKKSGSFVTGGTYVPATNNFQGLVYDNFVYQKTKPAWTVGVNYKPARDVLLYGKYSDSFVSGGSVGGVAFKPETASSFEVGGKADFLNHRLRTNLSLFAVEYRNLQSAQGGTRVGHPEIGTIITDQGNANAKGAEFEVNARPFDELTLGGSVGYTDIYFTALQPIILESYEGQYTPTLVPKWTADLSAQYEIDPRWRGSRLIARMDASWHSRERVAQQLFLNLEPGADVLENIPADWNVNARVSLSNIEVAGHTVEIAGWVKNLTQSRLPSYPLDFAYVASSSFVAARTYGLDLSFQF